MKKWLKIVGWVFLVAFLVLVVALIFAGGPIIKNSVNTVGPHVMGVPVTLQDVVFKPFQGRVTLKGLHVGNPEGFQTSGIFDMDLLDIDVDMSSLAKRVIIIREIRIEAPKITYERALKNSNIGTLLEKLAPPADDSEKSEEKSAIEKGGKKVIIRNLEISGTRVNVSMTALGGHAFVLPMPPLHMTNIGADTGGASLAQALHAILSAILNGVTDLVAGAGKLAIDGVKAVGGAAVDGAKAVGGAAVDGATAVGGAAVDGAKAVGGVAVDGAKAVGGAAMDVGGAAVDGVKAVGSGVGKVAGAVTGFFKSDEAEAKPQEPAEDEAAGTEAATPAKDGN